jgi:endogenous inhibitor of DNA gyrase (YacG/DUF329 family)
MVKILAIKARWYKCAECGHESKRTTNHTEDCYPECRGRCRQIMYPNTAREVVLPKYTTHKYVGEVE